MYNKKKAKTKKSSYKICHPEKNVPLRKLKLTAQLLADTLYLQSMHQKALSLLYGRSQCQSLALSCMAHYTHVTLPKHVVLIARGRVLEA